MTTLCVQQNILPRVMNTQLVRFTKKSEVKVWRHSKRLWRSKGEMSYAGLYPDQIANGFVKQAYLMAYFCCILFWQDLKKTE